ncbi:hypothetical protein ACOMHN_066614 [Nucella lapillus]
MATDRSETSTQPVKRASIVATNGQARAWSPQADPGAGGEGQRRESGASLGSTESFEDYIPSPPDGGWGWVVVVASLFCNMIVDGIGYSFGVFLLEFADYFQESKSKVSLVGSLLCGVYLFAGPVVSALTNRFGCRPVVMVGSVVAGLAFVLSITAPSVNILIITYGVLGGFGLGMIYLPAIVSVGYYFEKKRALATGIAVCGSGIGTFIFAPLSEYLLQELDWKNALMVLSGITLNGAVCGMLMRPLEQTTRRPRSTPLHEHTETTRIRTCSESSAAAHSARDPYAVLERVLEAKLQREQRLQEDESDLGSLPSLLLARQLSHREAAHKDTTHRDTTHKDSPQGSTPRISSLPPTSLPILAEAAQSLAGDALDTPPSLRRAEESSGYETTEVSQSTSDMGRGGAGDRGEGHHDGDGGTGPGSLAALSQASPSRTSEDATSGTVTFVDADSGTLGDGTNTERSEYATPPTSPPDTRSPSTPGRDGPTTGVPVEARNGLVQRKSDPAVMRYVTQGKDLKNGSVPFNIHHHVHEIEPLLEVPESKRTLVNLGSERNIWRLRNVKTPVVGQSLMSLSVSKKDLARPLYRKDIFYSGSVHTLPLFRSQPDMKSYITSITTIPGQTAFVAGGEAKVWRYLCVPQSVKDTLQEMLDFSLLKNSSFLLICLGNVLAFLGFYVPFVFCVDLAVSLGISKSNAAFLISVIGITNTVGRVVTGWLADLRRINSLVITYVSIFICGLSTALFPFCTTYGLLCAAASLFGLSVAAFISLSSILICDLLGLEKLTNGFGLLSLFRGLAAMTGPPLAGFVYDQTKTYDASFYLGGALLTMGGLCHLALYLPCIPRMGPVVMETVSVQDMAPPHAGSGVKPEILTLEDVMTSA